MKNLLIVLVLLMTSITLHAQFTYAEIQTPEELFLASEAGEDLTYVVMTTRHEGPVAIHHSRKYRIILEDYTGGLIKISGNFPSYEMAMMVSSVKLDSGPITFVRAEHEYNVVYVKATVSRQTLAMVLTDYFAI